MELDSSFNEAQKPFRIHLTQFEYSTNVEIFKNNKRILLDNIKLSGDPSIIREDFNNDGTKDFLLVLMNNHPTTIVHLFNNSSKSFDRVINSEEFPESYSVPNTKNIYYSYHSSGCADMIWDSDLFTIKNNCAISLANIHGDACVNRKIEIRKSVGNSTKLIQTLSLKAIEKYKDSKWGFIRAYWRKNWVRFI